MNYQPKIGDCLQDYQGSWQVVGIDDGIVQYQYINKMGEVVIRSCQSARSWISYVRENLRRGNFSPPISTIKN